jgi:predicted RND superfamily exporter protein
MRWLHAGLTLPVRRPVATLLFTALLTAVAIVGISRLRFDTSIESMFAKSDPSADAMVRVLHEFGAVEELVVLAESPNADPPRLLEFAKRFEEALKASPESASLVDAVYYRADEDTKRFVEHVITPSGIFYLDDATFAEATKRLTPAGMRQQLQRNAAMISQPGAAASAAAKALNRDPLRLFEFLKPRLAVAGGSFATASVQDALISADKQAILIRVVGKRPPSDLEFCKQLVDVTSRAVNAANTDRLSVSVGGSYAIAATSERAIRADSISSVTGAFGCLVVLFAVVYRQPIRLMLLAVGPLALGSLLGFGAYAFAERSMTVLSAAVGAMMVGMGIDYSVHYLTHYERLRRAGNDPAGAASACSIGLWPALFAAWITSVMGFAVIGLSDIPALGTFALLGSLGLAGVFFTSLTVVPALLVLSDGNREKSSLGGRARLRFSVDPLLTWISRHARFCIACSFAVFIASAGIGFFLPGPILPLEPDLTVMHPLPNPALETQERIAKRFGSVPGSMLVYLRSDSPGNLVELAHHVDERLSTPAVRNAGITGSLGLSTFLPDPKLVARRRDGLSEARADQIVNDFRAALADSPFEATRFEAYTKVLRELLTRRDAPTLTDVLGYRRLAQSFLPSSALQAGAAPPTEAITLITLSGTLDERSRRAAAVEAARKALADVSGATVAGMSVLGHDAEIRAGRAVPRLLLVSLGLVLVYVITHFRSMRDALLSLTTATFGMTVLLAIMRLAHVRLNMINLIGLPLLIGMTVDYGIFLVSLARLGRGHGPDALREHVASSAQAVLVCAGATFLGFGSLLFISVPAVQSLGVVVVIGMAAALASALFLLIPVLLTFPPRMKKGQTIKPAP